MNTANTYGRVRIRNGWRPAYIAADGTMYVAPSIAEPWRTVRRMEQHTWQARIPAEQHTVGRIWDDTLYVVA
jgi:hypothetical protein